MLKLKSLCLHNKGIIMKPKNWFRKAVKKVKRYLDIPGASVYYQNVSDDYRVVGIIADCDTCRVFVKGKPNEPIKTLIEDDFIGQKPFSILQNFILVSPINYVEMVNLVKK